MQDRLLFSGPANPGLGHAVAATLRMGLAPCDFVRFPDGEISVRLDASVRERHVVIVQPTSPPVNDRLMELLAFADACRRASAASVTAVMPYFGYARADRRQGLRVPVTASMVAALLEAVGIHHVVTLDVHSQQVEGFFRIAVDNLSAVAVLAEALKARAGPGTVVVAPDLGAVKLATAYGQQLGAGIAVVHKLRRSATDVTSVGITGDVRGRRCIVVDDMITTGGTVENAVAAVTAAGATGEVVVAATHGVLTGAAWERLARAGVRELLVTDSVPVRPAGAPAARIVTVAGILADALTRAYDPGAADTT